MICSPPDTCIIYVIPAIEVRNGSERSISIVMDKDGDWFVDYTGAYLNKREPYSIHDNK